MVGGCVTSSPRPMSSAPILLAASSRVASGPMTSTLRVITSFNCTREIVNGGGGWVYPMHMHMEEHHILLRNGQPAQGFPGAPVDPRHADDIGKDDVVLLDPSESVMFYRNFRTFTGKYVAHCHNLAHEDHAMMFGWEIIP